MAVKKNNPDGVEDDSLFPDHEPIIPFDTKKEKEKEELRKYVKQLREKSNKLEIIVRTKEGILKKATDLNKIEQTEEFVRCATDPIYFIETYLTVFDQTKGVGGEIVPFVLFDFQRDLIHKYLDHRFVISNKYRQAGISTCTCAYISWYVMFNQNRSVAIVADKLETARDEIMNDVVEFINGCPTWLRPKTGKETTINNDKKFKDTQKLKRYDNDSTLSAFSSKGLRGYTPTLLFWDETAWTEKGDKFWTAAKPTLSTGGRAIMVSTPSGLDPVFYKTFEGARAGTNNFHAVLLYWFNDPRYNKGLVWYKNKGKENEIAMPDTGWSNEQRIKFMDDKWTASSPWFEDQVKDANGDMRKIAQEILGSFLGSGDNFIAEEYLKRIEDEEVKVPIRQEYVDRNMFIYEDPILGEDYIIAVDASAGHGEDNSTINLIKKTEIIEEKTVTKGGKIKKVKIKRYISTQVAEYYGKITPQALAEIVYQYGKAYNDAYCVVDITGGYGIQTIEKLLEFGYENIHYAEVSHKPSRDRLSGYVKKGTKVMADGNIINVDLIPGFFIGNNRASVVLELQRAIHLKDVIIRSVRLLSELKTFVTVAGNRVADHKRTFHDDSIMGLSIGLYVLNFDMAKFKQSKGVTEKLLNALLTNNDINDMEKERGIKKPIISSMDAQNPYMVNAWLFGGLKRN